MDFLSNNDAVIKCRDGAIYQSDTFSDDTVESTFYALAVADDVFLPAFFTVCVDAADDLPCEAVHAIAKPNRDVLFSMA